MGENVSTLEKTFTQVTENKKELIGKNDGLDFSSHLISIFLRFKVTWTNTVGGGSITPKEDGWLNFIKNIRLQANSIGEIRNLSGEMLWKLNYYLSGGKSTMPTPDNTNGAGRTQEFVIEIPFTNDDAIFDLRKLCNLWRNDSGELNLQVTYGALTDVFTLAGGATQAFTSIELTVDMVEDTDLRGHFPILIVTSELVTLQNKKEQQYTYNPAHPTRAFALKAEDASALNSDTSVERIRLRLNKKDIVFNELFKSIQQGQKKRLPEGLITGFALKNFDPDSDITGTRDFRSRITEFLIDSTNLGSVEIGSLMIRP